MTLTEIYAHVTSEASKYEEDEFEQFCAEIGWEDWMNDYTDAAEGEPITENEKCEIDDILFECFKEAHDIREYEVVLTDSSTGASSTIDTIKEHHTYTAENYVSDCIEFADDEYNEMLSKGTVTLVEIKEQWI